MTQETETITGPERIWLLDYPDVSATWCQDPDPDGEHSDSIEYVRADLSTNKDETIAKSLSDVIAEAKRNLRLTQGCLECNAEDQRRWTETIAWLEGLA